MYGAGGETRTRTSWTPDSKSGASAIPPHPQVKVEFFNYLLSFIEINGTPEGTRTPNVPGRSRMLCPIELLGHIAVPRVPLRILYSVSSFEPGEDYLLVSSHPVSGFILSY